VMRANLADFFEKLGIFLNRELPKAAELTLNGVGGLAVEQSDNICPKLTGNLASTIRTVEGKKDEFIFVTVGGIRGTGSPPHDVDYEFWVHEGTTRMSPRPFLAQGTNDAVQKFNYSSVGRALGWR